MKKKKRNFIIKICSLLLLGIISITLLGSWTYNPTTDTITSDNLWNEDYVNGTYNTTNGFYDTSSLTFISSKDLIDIQPNTQYYIRYYTYTTRYGYFFYYDNNNNFLSYTAPSSTFSGGFTFTTPNNAYKMHFSIYVGNATTYENGLMFNLGSSAIPYEPFGTYVNQQKLDDLELDYDDLAEQYSNLYDDYTSLQSQYNDLSSRFSTLTDEYDSLLEEYQDLQQQIVDLNSQITELSKISSNLYNLFYHCDIYVFEDTTNKGIDYYSSHLSEADSSFMQLVISSTAVSFNYEMIPDYIRTFIASSEDYCFVLFKFNNTDLNGLYNIFFNDYTFDFEVQLYNDVTNQKFTYNMLDNGSLSNAIVIDTNNILYNYMLFDTTMDYHFTKFYTSDFTNVYNQGYENGIRQNYLVIDDLRSQVKIANNTITSLRRQIDSLNEQLANNIGWKPLFFAMADTPFKVVANVLGFEVFGVNLFKVFVGIITGLAIIWLLKKLLGK